MAIERACSINCTAMQIFVKNNMQWFARPLSTDEIRAFLDHQQRAQLGSVFAHANYLINLAATNPQFHANSLRALAEELIRADHLGWSGDDAAERRRFGQLRRAERRARGRARAVRFPGPRKRHGAALVRPHVGDLEAAVVRMYKRRVAHPLTRA